MEKKKVLGRETDNEIQVLLKENTRLREEINEINEMTSILKTPAPSSGFGAFWSSPSNSKKNLEYSEQLIGKEKTSTKSKRKSKKKLSKYMDSEFEDSSAITEVSVRGEPIMLKTDGIYNGMVAKRIIGEIAFQLDRRILQCIFSQRKRLYGFTVRNINEKIEEYSTNMVDGKVDIDKKDYLQSRYQAIMDLLRTKTGYNPKYHPIFSEMLVNAFGVLNSKPKSMELKKKMNEESLKSVILDTLSRKYTYDAIVLLTSLSVLRKVDKQNMFL